MDTIVGYFDQKKKKTSHLQPSSHDKSSGTGTSSTKRHLEVIKRKVLAFMDHRSRIPSDDKNVCRPPASPAPCVSSHCYPQPICVNQNRTPKERLHQHTPLVQRKELEQSQYQVPLHKQLPYLALATPCVTRRL
ncbi:unnamed protein product [Rotaria sp. Silwood1]|nr:unnamed protein product [Rotaria sp. Silwood1]CAF1624532.1 unnamed protein product [Rotaria sp. Silwood1]CAF3724075.1 unnamed protein product [Rotaria sp. Silwood1]CAF3783597.1 unnamed protein product [Rotaria sp. Silwood1]CAF4797199.1 unnamed protein product [Rotaria sp. Silwood1]